MISDLMPPEQAKALAKRQTSEHIRAITRPVLRDWRMYVVDFRSALEMLSLAVCDLLGYRVFTMSQPRVDRAAWSTELKWEVSFRRNRLGRLMCWWFSKLRRSR